MSRGYGVPDRVWYSFSDNVTAFLDLFWPAKSTNLSQIQNMSAVSSRGLSNRPQLQSENEQ